MVRLELKTHDEVLSKQGNKFYVKSTENNVYATMCIDGTIAYTCLTDEDPTRCLQLTDNRLNNAMCVESFELI